MSLFKILKGDSSRISTDVTPFHDGYAYFTPDDGGLYIDAIVNNENKRVRVAGDGGGSTNVSATLTAAGWSSGQQTISVAGATANTNGIISIPADITASQLSAVQGAGLYVSAQSAGSLTIAASGDVPTIDIPVVIILFA